MQKIKLSPSTLSLYDDCPKCFWLERIKNIRRPRGIFPSLPKGMDSVIKKYFDKYRIKNEMPPEVKKKLPGKLFSNMEILERWRSWFKTDLRYEDSTINAILSGALDDCLVENDFYIPLDYKTRGSELIEDPKKYYQIQLDCYCFILDSCGFKTKGVAYLLYLWPLEVLENGKMQFKVKPIEIKTNIDSAKKIFNDAVNCLRQKMPIASPNCEYCNFFSARRANGE
jgi:hypothetical protein